MRCPDCGAEMLPLATSVYCPNDCDRKVTEFIDPEKTEKIVWPRPSANYSVKLNVVDSADDPDLDWTDVWGLDTD